jgi:hypothetical protein
MRLNDMAERIITSGVCPAEINNYNATRIMDWVRSGGHPADGCKIKHCVHAPGVFTVAHAARLVNESPEVCTCGNHK